MKRIFLCLLASPLIIAACATKPASAPAPPAAGPEPSLARVQPATEPLGEPPAPFVKLVDLRRLRVGMTMEEVLAIFPGPEETRLRAQDTVVWRYRFAELYFRDERLYNWFNLERDY